MARADRGGGRADPEGDRAPARSAEPFELAQRAAPALAAEVQQRVNGPRGVEVAERGLCHAARDVSMPGLAGSLLQLLELAGCGATLDVDRVPRPDGVALGRWLVSFPSFGFVLAAAPEHVEAACAAFARRDLACAPCGAFDDSRVLRLTRGGESAEVWDLGAEPLTSSG